MSNVLNVVEGLDIEKLVTIIKDETTGEEKKYMPVTNRVLWFRMANPFGKIVTNIVERTDSFAVVEARIYLSKDDEDKNYIAKGTAQREYSKDATYSMRNIEWAETAAIGRALSLAGYGTQFCSEELGDNGPVDSPVSFGSNTSTKTTAPNKSVENTKSETVKTEVKTQEKKNVVEETTVESKTTVEDNITKADVVQASTVEVVQDETIQNVEVNEQPKAEIVKSEVNEQPKNEEKVVVKETEQTQMEISSESVTEVNAEETDIPNYTKLTPVEDILNVMTLEEAENTILDIGPLKGNTMKFILEEDESKVRWLVNSYAGNNNILKASAKILIDNLTSKAC